MRHLPTISLYGFLILFVLTLLACTTVDEPRFETALQVQQSERYNLQVRIVTHEELKKQAGRAPSPFVIEPGLFDPREYVVVEIIIKNKTDKPAGFDLNDLEMQLAAGRYYTKNVFQVKQYWDRQDSVRSADKQRMGAIAERYMLPREVSVPAGGLKRGYAVFLVNVPKYGEMTVYIPMLGEGFKPDIFEFTFPFTKI